MLEEPTRQQTANELSNRLRNGNNVLPEDITDINDYFDLNLLKEIQRGIYNIVIVKYRDYITNENITNKNIDYVQLVSDIINDIESSSSEGESKPLWRLCFNTVEELIEYIVRCISKYTLNLDTPTVMPSITGTWIYGNMHIYDTIKASFAFRLALDKILEKS